MLPHFRYPIHRGIALLACLAGLLVASCDQREQIVDGGSDDTHSSVVDIQGRVLTKDARPFGNVIVRLRGLGLRDTTDSDGRFRFQRDSIPVAARAASAVDTVDYLRDGQVILSAPVPAWVSTMPDVMLVQRDLSGKLLGDLSQVGAVTCLLGAPGGASTVILLELNRTTRLYSGYAYFRYTGGVDSFTARIVVSDSGGVPMGVGTVVRFSSRAGDIAFPDLGATNAVPRIRLRGESDGYPFRVIGSGHPEPDTIGWSEMPRASRRERLVLHAELTDSQLVAARVEWFLGGAWVRASGPTPMPMTPCPTCYMLPGPDPVLPSVSLHFDTALTVPTDAQGWWSPRVRVVDTLGRTFEGTLAVRVVPLAPWASLDLAPSGALPPGSRLNISMADSEGNHGRIVSRRIYLGRTPFMSTNAYGPGNPWTGGGASPAIVGVEPGSSSSWQASQGSVALVETRQFRSNNPSIEVSGNDTSVTLSGDSVGEFGVVFEVVDEDGDTGIYARTILVRPPAPRIESLVVSHPDSVVVGWSYDFKEGTWLATGGWEGVPDTFRVVVKANARRLSLPRPIAARNLRLRLRRIQPIEGFPADTILTSLPLPVLTFTGASADTSRLFGVAGALGPRGFGRLFAGPGARLPGEVARLVWSAGDAYDVSGAFAWFPLAAAPGSRRFHVEVANRSAVEVRVKVLASSIWDYSDRVAAGTFLHWTIPADFDGPLDLDVEALRWSAFARNSDTSGIDRELVLANIDAIQFEVVQFQDSTVRSGVLELDDLGWR